MPIDDIVFGPSPFILEIPTVATGTIKAVSFDGKSYDFNPSPGETITIIIS